MSYGGTQADFGDDNFQTGSISSFEDKAVRLGFIRKVYGILSCQLVVTCAIIGIFFIKSVREYSVAHPEMWWIALALTLISLITMACCGEIRRKTPHNFIFLGLFTLAEGFMLGCVTSLYQADEVLLAAGICAALVFALTIFAFQTKIDFTAWGGVLMVAVLCLLLFGLFALIFQSRVLNIFYASIGAFIFSCYIIFDTQLMMGGSHKYSLSPEEYIFAALNLYLDIVNLFLYILSLVNSARN